MEDFYTDKYKGTFYSSRDIIRTLIAKIIGISNRCGSNFIVTNGNLVSALSESEFFHYAARSLDNGTWREYLGTINGTKVYIDPNMRFDDNRFLFYQKKNRVVDRVYSEMDPYGEENWNDDNYGFGDLIQTLIVHDENGVLI